MSHFQLAKEAVTNMAITYISVDEYIDPVETETFMGQNLIS